MPSRSARSLLKQPAKSHSAAAAPARRHTFASLRALQPVLSYFSRAAALDAASSGAAAASQCCSSRSSIFLSPLGVTVAGSPSRAAACEASAESGVRLASGSIPVHADPCKGFTYVGMAKRALQVRNVYATAADSMPSRICTARCSPVISLSDEHAALRDAASTVHALAPLCRPRHGLFWSCRGGSIERISSAWFWRGLHFSCANGALLYEVHLHVGPHRQVPYWKMAF